MTDHREVDAVTAGEPIEVRAAPPSSLELPGPHLELTWRHLTADDVDALHGLMEATEEADGAPVRTSREEVVDRFDREWVDPSSDFLGGFDADGVLRAYGLVEVRPGETRTVRAFLDGGVHPDWRGRGVGRAVLNWMEGRGRQLVAATGKDLPARIAVHVDEHSRDQRRLYAAAGFSPIRWYTVMRRDLATPLPAVTLPDDVRVEPWSSERDEAVRLAHNEAFTDHWGSEPRTPAEWARHGPHFVPGWSFVALTGADEVAGYAMSARYEADWPVVGYSSGCTDLLGVRRAWRGRGVGAALLAASMAAFRADGMEYAILGVDTDNPSGAHHLYARLGYEPTHTEIMYSVEL